MSRRRLKGAVVVLTGASSGIGRSTALAFARAGSRVVLAARGAETLEQVAAECRELGASVLVAPTDVSDEAQVKQLAQTAVQAFGRIDVWVGNASVFAYGRFEDQPAEVFRQQIETNLFGEVYGARAALEVFRRQGGGSLVIVASLFSKVTAPYTSGYATAKHALLGFGETLQLETAGSKVHVSKVLPATIDTPIYQHAANYTGKPVHPLTPAVDPRRVAAAIVKVSHSPRRQVVVGSLQGLTIPLHAAAFGLYSPVVRFAMRYLSLRRGHVDISDGTVFAPDQQLSGETGGWRWPLWKRAGLILITLGAAARLVSSARPRRR